MESRHAYYLASDDSLHGDADPGSSLRDVFARFRVERHSAIDGISCFTRPDGSIVTRLVMRDFFSETHRAFVIDL